MEIKKVFRQGDVLIMAVRGAPKAGALVPREGGRVVLAHGEVTGHSHAIVGKGAALYALNEQTLDRLLKVGSKGVILRHEEHGEIRLPSGSYIVRIQREYTADSVRNVAD